MEYQVTIYHRGEMGQIERTPVQLTAQDVFTLSNQCEMAKAMILTQLNAATQNINVGCRDAYCERNGRHAPSVGIRMCHFKYQNNKPVWQRDVSARTDDIVWLIAGTLRKIEDDSEIVRIQDLMKIGYENAYVDLRAQAMAGGVIEHPSLGKRKISKVYPGDDTIYLNLEPFQDSDA